MGNICLEEWETYDTISYVAAIHMLLDERELVFNEYKNIVAPSITVENECWQVVKVNATGKNGEWGVDWDTIELELQLENANVQKEVVLSSETISQRDAFELLCAVYAIMDNGEYEDLWEFLGYEIS